VHERRRDPAAATGNTAQRFAQSVLRLCTPPIREGFCNTLPPKLLSPAVLYELPARGSRFAGAGWRILENRRRCRIGGNIRRHFAPDRKGVLPASLGVSLAVPAAPGLRQGGCQKDFELRFDGPPCGKITAFIAMETQYAHLSGNP
jgi:hypothetical protein